MASTAGKVDIFNMALGFVGTRTVASGEERTPEAIQCNLYWDRARRAALRDYPWSFATRRVELARKPLPDVYAGVWRYAYALPDGCLKVQRLGQDTEPGRRTPFAIESDAAGLLLLCDAAPARAVCTFDVTEVARFDELFVLCMARRLACLVAVPLLKNNPGKVQELEQLYQLALPQSQGQDASERRLGRSPDAWLQAREAW